MIKAREASQNRLIAWGLALAFVIGVLLHVFYSHTYDSVLPKMAIGLVMISTIGFGVWRLQVFPDSRWGRISNVLLGVILLFLMFFSLFAISTFYQNGQLEKYGEVVSGKVETIYMKTGRNSREYAVFQYTLSGKQYHQEIWNDKNLSIGDSVTIKCSSQNPEIFSLISYKTRK
ncbi:hypothetical protein [Nibribacter koreensis]|uniref:hypothetical protein n=1 Tax=Nibribacter koreensis TaxID=1084519 RepID=UPI0031E5FDA3